MVDVGGLGDPEGGFGSSEGRDIGCKAFMDSQAAQMGYITNSYQASQMIAPQHPQLEYHHQLQAFWANQIQEMQRTVDFKTHSLPLARIKKIMKADEDVKMISAEAPVVFAKACEMFILELTLRSWFHTEENKRRTLQKNDIAAAISRTDIFDFLVDIVPRDELKEEGVAIPRAALPLVNPPPPPPPPPPPAVAESVPYYYVAPQPPMAYIPQQMWPKAPSSNS